MKLPMEYQDIIRILPHRYPFLLVDRIVALEAGKNAVGIKNVSANEAFFQGHFPGNPIMPGVLIVEALAQVGAVLARFSLTDSSAEGKGGMVYFAAIDKVKFLKPVVPGDQLELQVEALRTGSRFWKMGGTALVGGAVVAKAEVMGAVR